MRITALAWFCCVYVFCDGTALYNDPHCQMHPPALARVAHEVDDAIDAISQALTHTAPSPAPCGCRLKRRVVAAASAQAAAVARLASLDKDRWDEFLEHTGIFDPTPATTGATGQRYSYSWVGRAVDGLEHVVRMLTAAAASDSVPPAADPGAAAAADGAGSSVQQSPHLQAHHHGPQPADQAAAAAAGSPFPHPRQQQHMMDMLVPVELQPWQSHELKDNDSSYSGATAMRPLREWLTMRGREFGSGLVAAIIRRFG